VAITLFGSVAVPTDNGTNTSNPTAFANPPIASMVAGDLVFIYAYCRTASATIAISNAGGQTWNSFSSQSSANATLSANVFWCIFNGTWSAAPSVSFGATTNNSAVMLVFRPTSSQYSWAVDGAQAGTFVDRAAAASFTITGWTPQNNSNVSIAVWNTDDDNTWGTLTGANWIKTSLSAQYRNTSGNDTSSSFAYQIQTSAAATNNVSQTEATLGNDGGFTFAICFTEYLSPSTFPEVKQPFFPAKTNVRLEKESVVGQPPPIVYEWVHRLIEQPFFGKTLVSASGQKNNSLSIPSQLSDADAQAFVDATGITDDTIKNAINDLVIAAKANGWWSRCIAIYPMVGGTSDTCKYNLKNPQNTDGAYRLTEHGGLTYASTGVTGNGTTGYLDTHIAANALSQNDWHISFYSRIDTNGTEVEMGSRGAPNVSADCFLEIRTSNVTYYGCNAGVINNYISFSDLASQGYYLGTRTGSANQAVYKNGATGQTGTLSSSALNNQNIYLLALNNSGTAAVFSTKECAFATAGSSIDSTLQATMYSDIQNFQTAIGRQV
jgi:hypothetical protein